MKKQILILLFLATITVLNINASESNIKDTTEHVIKLTHKKTERVVYIKKGDVVHFRINKKQYKGRIQSVSDKTLYMNNKEYNIFEISEISQLNEKTALRQIGAFLLKIGVSLFILGTVLGSLLLTGTIQVIAEYEIIAIFSFLYSLIVLPIGLVLYSLGIAYKYNLKTLWKVEVIRF